MARHSLIHWAMIGLVMSLSLMALVASGADLAVLSQRIEVPKPDGSGVAFLQLKIAPNQVGTLSGFRITALDFIPGQKLTLYNSVNSTCSGNELAADDVVPADGKVCFHSDTSSRAEFENEFSFVALSDADESSVAGTVRLINYNKQLCQTIPDLGDSQSFRAPPNPTVSIVLDGLQIKFTVTARYLRNDTSWFLDFFDYDITPSTGDSADGAGRTCANHDSSTFPASFADWWTTAPRATYNSSVDATIIDALNNATYPIYNPASTKWTVTALGCSTVKYEATIPISKLIRTTQTGDCKNGASATPAATPVGLVYSGSLFANAIRPRDRSDAASGYFKTTFQYPFSFAVQETVSNIGTISSKWTFAANVLGLRVDRGASTASLNMELQTTIDHPSLNSPDIASGVVLDAPRFGQRTFNLTRLSDNGQCDGSSTSACVIKWFMTSPQLSLATLGDDENEFALQYVGNWRFQFTTASKKRGDDIQVNIYIDSSAADPSVDLNSIPVNSSIQFFKSKNDMQTLATSGAVSPTFTSGQQIWVRHSFLVDDADVTAFTFSLKEAYICWSPIPGFVPSLSNGQLGCAADVPGVMEESQGQRIRLYDRTSLSSGIANVVDGDIPKIWDWTLVAPNAAGWTPAQLVHNGFGINALPLATTSALRTYYFHVVSTVAQTSSRRDAGAVYHSLVGLRSDTKDTGKLGTVSVEADQEAEADSGEMLRPNAMAAWLIQQAF